MSIKDMFNASSIKKENEKIISENQKLLSVINDMGAGDALTVKTKN